MTVKIYDKDSSHPSTDLARHTLAGEATFTLASLMVAKGQRVTLDLRQGRHTGNVTIRAEPVANTRDIFVVNFEGKRLPCKNGFGMGIFSTSDPFLQISRLSEDGSWVVVWRNEHIKNNVNPKFPQAKIPMAQLCNGDIDRPLRIGVFDFESSGKHQTMGHVETSVRGMLEARGGELAVIEPEKKKDRGYVNSGTLTAVNATVEQHATLQEYIMGGMEISMMMAIDFTGSNGDPATPQSLHFHTNVPGAPLNEYQRVISSVGSVLESYDTDKMFPVYGFGGRVRQPDGSWSTVQHCFPVYPGGLEVHGVPGIMKAYTDGLARVALSGKCR